MTDSFLVPTDTRCCVKPVGVELARDGIAAVFQINRVAWIASKLAPTDPV